mgnify:CR=1 FL=1
MNILKEKSNRTIGKYNLLLLENDIYRKDSRTIKNASICLKKYLPIYNLWCDGNRNDLLSIVHDDDDGKIVGEWDKEVKYSVSDLLAEVRDKVSLAKAKLPSESEEQKLTWIEVQTFQWIINNDLTLETVVMIAFIKENHIKMKQYLKSRKFYYMEKLNIELHSVRMLLNWLEQQFNHQRFSSSLSTIE